MKRKLLGFIVVVFASIQVFAGQGGYLEFKMTVDKFGFSGNIKTYYLNGDSRSEVSMNVGMKVTVVGLYKKSEPGMVYLLNEDSKTYTEMDVSDAKTKSQDDEDYNITVVGKEKVNGYKCTHVKIKAKKSNLTQDMWLSTDVPDYSYFKGAKNKYLQASDKLYEALEAKGASGFPVRLTAEDKQQGSVTVDLVKAEKKNLDASLFSLDGYTRSSMGLMGNMQDMLKQLQNMSPDEQKQMMEQMQQMYKKE